VYNEIRPGSIVPSQFEYSSAGSGRVGQSLAFVVSSTDDGESWTDVPVAVDPAAKGHQFFPDIDALDGTLAVVWQDNREDDDYSVQLPIGNAIGAEGPVSSDETVADAEAAIVNSYVATSPTETVAFGPSVKVSRVGHQSEFEMFGNRDIPFHGDYNWVSLARNIPSDPAAGLYGYVSWTDNRNVEPGNDPREEDYDDNFDVLQCRDDLADDPEGLLSPNMPLARRDAPFGGDTCGNAGGLDQDIFGISFTP
jgi:hypothetical protein